MAKQGKCTSCRIRYTWSRDIALWRTNCQKCGRILEATSRLNQWPVINLPNYKGYTIEAGNFSSIPKPEPEPILDEMEEQNRPQKPNTNFISG